MSHTSRENKEATFYHDSDVEPTKIRTRSTLSPSIRFGPGGKQTVQKAWWAAANSGVRIGPSNRPRPVEQLEDEFWEEKTTCSGHLNPYEDGDEDETRYWPWMTDMEMKWQPPTGAPVVDLLEMAKPSKRNRKRRHGFQVLLKPTIDQVLALDDGTLMTDRDHGLGSGVFSDYGSELDFDYHEVVDAVEWEDIALELDYVGDARTREELEFSGGKGRLTDALSRPRLSYAQALQAPSASVAQLPPSR